MSNDKLGVVTAGIANGSYVLASTGGLESMLNVIVLIVGLISGIVSITYTLTKWYTNATSDLSDGGKKITVNELKDLIDIIKEEEENGNKNK